MKQIYLITLFCLVVASYSMSQPVPAGDENIPFLMTFGPKAERSWGDDDFSQTFFFRIPKDLKTPFYIKVFDPDIGGAYDEINGVWDTRTTFSIFGGKECYTNKDAQETQPAGNYKSGNLLATKTFGENPQYDNNWYTFGPFNPTEGELVTKFDG